RDPLHLEADLQPIADRLGQKEALPVEAEALAALALDERAIGKKVPTEVFVAAIVVGLREVDDLQRHRARLLHPPQRHEDLREPDHGSVDENGIAVFALEPEALLEGGARCCVVTSQQLCPPDPFESERNLAEISQAAPYAERILHPGRRSG